MICHVCTGREARGFGWVDLKAPKKKQVNFQACSMRCLDILAKKKGIMDDPTPNEIESMIDAGEKGGEYLEAIQKTELTALSQDEWMIFIDCVITSYIDSLKTRTGWVDLREASQVPF